MGSFSQLGGIPMSGGIPYLGTSHVFGISFSIVSPHMGVSYGPIGLNMPLPLD